MGPLPDETAYAQSFHPSTMRPFDCASVLDVGGENTTSSPDMGVAGHLDAYYEIAVGNDARQRISMFGAQPTPYVLGYDMDAPRYVVVRGDTGWSGLPFVQDYSDIHCQHTPTPIATQSDCGPGSGRPW